MKWKLRISLIFLCMLCLTSCSTERKVLRSIPELCSLEELRAVENGIVYFYSDQCGSCSETGPALEEYYQSCPLELYKFNLSSMLENGYLSAEEASAFCDEFGLIYVPVLIRFENSVQAEHFPDYASEETSSMKGTEAFIEYLSRFPCDVSVEEP